MTQNNKYIKELLQQLKRLREESGITAEELENRLNIGKGWIDSFEKGLNVPSINVILSILHILNKSLPDLINEIPSKFTGNIIDRKVAAKQSQNNLLINFDYANHDAAYTLPNATIGEFEEVIKTLRDGLSKLTACDNNSSEAIKTDSVARAFLKSVQLWPHANPSDLWWFVIYRIYCDPYNHPAQFFRLDFTQSWKRTGGWALEEVFVRHYGPFLKQHGINFFIASSEIKKRLLKNISVKDRLEVDKVDVVLAVNEKLLGVVHVKASFAERRTDDVPMSKALIEAGYISSLCTMDCKSTPSVNPYNKGELGELQNSKSDNRSAKRKDIEGDGYFSACFSYNSNTIPTPLKQKAKARIMVCNFNNPDDAFSQFILNARKNLRSG